MWAELVYLMRMAVPPQDVPPPPPPPPPAEKPKPPAAPIRVSGSIQSAMFGPGARWVNYLSPEAIHRSRKAVEVDPNDVCARGDLLTHLESDERYEHLHWMITHHPEWDGFYLPDGNFGSRTADERGARRDESWVLWQQAVDRNPHSAIVLYNAAMFFAIEAPERATALLTEALRIEPGEPRFRRGLGRVFGLAQVDPARVRLQARLDFFEPHLEFARYAREQLEGSDDLELLGGALMPFFGFGGYRPSEFIKELRERPASISRERNYLEVGGVTESRYTQSSCWGARVMPGGSR